MTALNPTLATFLAPATGTNAWLRHVGLALAGSLLVAAAAQVSVPMFPVPMTLQTLAVLAIGAAFGARLGAATLALYMLEGAVGLPVFSGFQAGFFRPEGGLIFSGGYILGFIAAAGLVGWLAERGFDRSIPKMLFAMLAGTVVIYIPGLIWLGAMVGGFEKAITFGLAPFWAGDLVKAAIAALGFPAVWSLISRKA